MTSRWLPHDLSFQPELVEARECRKLADMKNVE